MHFRKSHISEELLLRKIYNLLNALYFDALSGLTNNFSWHFRRYLTCSWHHKTKPRIHQFTTLKCCIKSLLKPIFNGVLFLIYYFKKHLKSCFFILKALKDILQHFKFVNWRIGKLVVSFLWCHEQVIHYLH